MQWAYAFWASYQRGSRLCGNLSKIAKIYIGASRRTTSLYENTIHKYKHERYARYYITQTVPRFPRVLKREIGSTINDVKPITYNGVPPFFHFFRNHPPDSRTVGFKRRLSQLSTYRYTLPIAVCQCSSVGDDVVDVQQNALEKFPSDKRFALPGQKENEYYEQQREFAFVQRKKWKRIQNPEKYVVSVCRWDYFA